MGSKLMRVCRGWGMRWDMEVPECLLGFTCSFLLHHSCKFVALSRSICLHFHGFVAKEEIEPKVSGANCGVNVTNAHCQQFDFSRNSTRAVRAEGWAAD